MLGSNEMYPYQKKSTKNLPISGIEEARAEDLLPVYQYFMSHLSILEERLGDLNIWMRQSERYGGNSSSVRITFSVSEQLHHTIQSN